MLVSAHGRPRSSADSVADGGPRESDREADRGSNYGMRRQLVVVQEKYTIEALRLGRGAPGVPLRRRRR